MMPASNNKIADTIADTGCPMKNLAISLPYGAANVAGV